MNKKERKDFWFGFLFLPAFLLFFGVNTWVANWLFDARPLAWCVAMFWWAFLLLCWVMGEIAAAPSPFPPMPPPPPTAPPPKKRKPRASRARAKGAPTHD